MMTNLFFFQGGLGRCLFAPISRSSHASCIETDEERRALKKNDIAVSNYFAHIHAYFDICYRNVRCTFAGKHC
jgi:hypothetical protein